MKTILAATAIVLSATAGAYADSSLLDVYKEPVAKHEIDHTATAAIGSNANEVRNPRLGDGAPVAGVTDLGAVFNNVHLGARK